MKKTQKEYQSAMDKKYKFIRKKNTIKKKTKTKEEILLKK